MVPGGATTHTHLEAHDAVTLAPGDAEALDALVERDVKAIVVACNTSTAVALGHFRRRYDLPILGVVRPGAVTAALTTRNRRVGVIATPATVRSHAYFSAIKDENPAVEVYEHATPAFVPLVEAGRLAGPEVASIVEESLAPLLGTRDAAGDFVFPLPPSARIDTLLLGCTHYPLLRPVIAEVAGDRVAIVDSATATASALVELLAINGLEAPGTSRGTAADAGRDGHEAPDEVALPPTHVQLTTGDVDAFRTIAERIFGEAFPEIESVEVGPRGSRSAAGPAHPAGVAS
jgi:glutamate racemase